MEKIEVINKDDIGEKGEKIYGKLQDELEHKHKGEFVAIDVESGDYFLGKSLREADERARNKYPDKVFYIIRIGRKSVWVRR